MQKSSLASLRPVLLPFALLCSVSASAQTTWIGGTSGAPNTVYNAGNWSNGLPATAAGVAFTQNAIIDGSTSTVPAGSTIGSSQGSSAINLGADSLTIGNGGILVMSKTSGAITGSTGNSLTVTGSNSNNGSTLTWAASYTSAFSGVNLTVGTGGIVSSVGSFSTGSLAITGGSFTATGVTLTNYTALSMSAGTLTAGALNSAAGVTLTGGTLNLSSTTTPISGGGAISMYTGANFTNGLVSSNPSAFDGLLIVNGVAWANAVEGVNYTISGTTITAVPEPSAYGLLGAGALAAVAVVSRRRKFRAA